MTPEQKQELETLKDSIRYDLEKAQNLIDRAIDNLNDIEDILSPKKEDTF